MGTTLKVAVLSKFETGSGQYRQVKVDFTANYSDPANKAWSVATPSLNFSMTVKGELADGMEIGQAYTLLLTPDAKPEPELDAEPEAAAN